MYSDTDQLIRIKRKLESEGFKVEMNGQEHTLSYAEREQLKFDDSLESMSQRLTPDLKATKDDGIFPISYWDGKTVYNSNNFYPELMGLVLADKKQSEPTFYCIQLPSDPQFDRVFYTRDYRILRKIEKFWYRPHLHSLDTNCWKAIGKYVINNGIYARFDTDPRFNTPYKVSADLCAVIPQSILNVLPTLQDEKTEDIMVKLTAFDIDKW